MHRTTLLALSLLCSTPAFAGSQSRDCATPDKSIVMGAGNSTNRIQIKFIDAAGKPAVHDVPVNLMPAFDYNTEETPDAIWAVPVSEDRSVSRKHLVRHVYHKDKTDCLGREQWDDHSVQSYVLTGKDGKSLDSALGGKIKGMNGDGYIVAQFSCHTYGVTSPGGCYANEGDKVVWENEK
ncbi:MAG: hypothetical protein ACXWR4_11365 [Bdellovibrionota bacterium]